MRETNFKHTDIGLIPQDWNIFTVANDCYVKARIGWQGLTTAEYLSSGDYGLVTSTDLVDGEVNWNTCHFVSEERYNQDTKIQVKEFDILVSKDGTIGKVGIVKHLPFPATLNSGVFVIRSNNDKQTQIGLSLAFVSPYFKDFINRLKAGSTIVHLYQKDLVNFIYPLPTSLKEQERISIVLSEMDELIAALDEKIAKKRLIKQGALQQLLIGKTRLEGFSGEWKQYKLGDVGEVCMCKRILKNETSTTGTVPFYKIGTFGKIADAYIPEELFKEYKRKYSYPSKGDILFSAAGTIGRCVEFDGQPAYFQDSNIVWIANDESKVCNSFLKYLYSVIEWNVDDGGIVKRLYNDSIRKTSFIAPSIVEQKAIAGVLSNMDAEIQALQEERAKYALIKQGMMQELLTGKIRI